MPELAEVEFFRKRWAQAATGQRVTGVEVHATAKIFRGAKPAAIRRALTGAKFASSETQAKQMLFCFTGGVSSPPKSKDWLGVHLGMSGELEVRPVDYASKRHDHLVLRFAKRTLVFSDPRMFGRVQFHRGKIAPAWWTRIAPPILSQKFTVPVVAAFLKRRARAPIKAVMLMQECFPGIGNWMADEILWRAAIHPRRLAGSLSAVEAKALWRECRNVCRLALDTIAGRGNHLPPDLNADIPKTWLFSHRWREGGIDPRTKTPLAYAEIGGRTTCWSPARQKI